MSDLLSSGMKAIVIMMCAVGRKVKKYFGAKREGLNAMVKDVPFEKFNVRTTIDQPFRWNDRLYLAPIQNAEVYKKPANGSGIRLLIVL